MNPGHVTQAVLALLRKSPWLDLYEIKLLVPQCTGRTLWRMVHPGKVRPAMLRRRPGNGRYSCYEYAVLR